MRLPRYDIDVCFSGQIAVTAIPVAIDAISDRGNPCS